MTTLNSLLREVYYTSKDIKRIESLKKKAGGDPEKEIKLATTMAKTIKNANKAASRSHAAHAEGLYGVAEIFVNRAIELDRNMKDFDYKKFLLAAVKAKRSVDAK
jgi:hypothetical protein